MARTSLYDLTDADDKVLLEGTLVYSALREKAVLKNPTPYDSDAKYRITIADPKVVKGGDNKLGKHILDEDITHGAYKSKTGQYAGHTMWSFNSKSKRPINIYTKVTGGDAVPADKLLKKELAPGQKVGVLFSIYSGKVPSLGTTYKSGSLDGVVIADPEHIKYFGDNYGTDYSDIMGQPKNELEKFVQNNSNDDADSKPSEEKQSDAPKDTTNNDDTKEKSDAEIKKDANDFF